MPSPLVDVVLFDLDDTVFAHSDAVAAGVLAHRHALGGRMAATDDAAEIVRWLALEEEHYHRYLAGEIDFMGQRRQRARAFVEPYGVDLRDDRHADEWFARYLAEYRRGWRLHDDTLPALDELAHRIAEVRFGIITNGVLDSQSDKIEQTGLGGRIEHLVTSGEFGITKPDSRIFLYACSLFDVQPDRVAYIGDRLRTDALGAASAGLRGVWICRNRTPTDEELAAAASVSTITTLTELPDLLAPLR